VAPTLLWRQKGTKKKKSRWNKHKKMLRWEVNLLRTLEIEEARTISIKDEKILSFSKKFAQYLTDNDVTLFHFQEKAKKQ
jgi:hypothetical protein